MAQRLKRLPGVQETRVQSLGREDPLEKAMAPHSSTLAWRIPWTEEPGRLQSMGSLRVRHKWATSLSLFTFLHWRGNGNPLQCSCLESPRDGGDWRAAVYGVAQSRTWLKWLSSSSILFSIVIASVYIPTNNIILFTSHPGQHLLSFFNTKHHNFKAIIYIYICAFDWFKYPSPKFFNAMIFLLLIFSSVSFVSHLENGFCFFLRAGKRVGWALKSCTWGFFPTVFILQ